MKRVKPKEIKKDFLGRIYTVEREVLSMKEKRVYLEKKEQVFVGRIVKKKKKEKFERIYKCKECLGKLCSKHLKVEEDLVIETKELECPEGKENKAWTWIATIPVRK